MNEFSAGVERLNRIKAYIKYLNGARTCANCTNSTDRGNTCLKYAIRTNKDASCSYHFLK